MNKNIIIAAVLGTIVLGGGIVWFLQKDSSTSPSEPIFVETKNNTGNTYTPSQNTPKETSSYSDEEKKVISNLSQQITSSGNIDFYNTSIISDYALQEWGDENKGGQALLKFNPSQGWILVTLGGGAWDALGLVGYGVPRSVTDELIAGLSR